MSAAEIVLDVPSESPERAPSLTRGLLDCVRDYELALYAGLG